MRKKVLTVLGLVFGFLALCVREIIKRASGLGRWVEDSLLTPPSLQIRGNIQAKKAKIQKARRSRHGKGEE